MNVKDLCERYNKGDKFSFSFFWGENYENGFLSNWLPCEFIVDGVKYWCTEQYMMAKKAELFGDSEVQAEIMKSKNQKEIKDLGRKVRNFDSELWDKNKVRIVYEGNLSKFSQNETLKVKMLNTLDSILVEASPYDKIWGIGRSVKDGTVIKNPNNWYGENLLGFLLMDVREALKKGECK